MRRRRGVALVLVLFVVFILAVLGFSAVSLATMDARSATQDVLAVRALNLARAGLSRAIAELRMDYTWGTSQSIRYDLQGGSYTVSVWESPANQGNAYKLWRVTSVGGYQGARRTVQAWLEMESFAKFAYFTNSELGQGNTTIWFVDQDRITGAAHTNGYFSIYRNPKFAAKVSSTNQTDAYLRPDYTYRQGGSTYTDPSVFYHYLSSYRNDYPIALNGSPNFAFYGGQPEIPLPRDTGQIAANAQYSFKGQTSLVFNANGTVTVREGTKAPQTLAVGTTTIHVSGQATVSGTVNGRVTVGATGGIDIPSSLVYADRSEDVLGLVSEGQIRILTDPNRRQDIEVDAAIMTLNNSFTVDRYNMGRARGTLHVFGGIIQKNRGPVGTFNSRTGTIATGYAKDYQYDDKLINMPPPNFPTTGNIVLRAFVDRGALGN